MIGVLIAGAIPVASPALADEQEQQPGVAAAPATAPSLGPSTTGPLLPNAHPVHVDGGPLGPIYLSGVISGIGLLQDNHFPGDQKSDAGLSNAMAIVQTVQGPVQFYVQAGAYAIPTLGTPFFKALHYSRNTYGYVPVAYVKIAPSSDFNVEIGKLFTLQGAENAFTFQNFNVERGLLFNQTSTINRGIQANYAHGPLSISVALTDGYYSKRYNWLSGTIGYMLSAKDSLTFGAAASLGADDKSTFATPTALNNGQLYFLSWTHGDGPWIIQPYIQFGHVPTRPTVGIPQSASTFGAAVLGKYNFTGEFALAARAEIIKSTGSANGGAPDLLYGPGSSAWSLTLTPTWQKGIFFARPEASYVRAWNVVPGAGLGPRSNARSQYRGLIEAGIIF